MCNALSVYAYRLRHELVRLYDETTQYIAFPEGMMLKIPFPEGVTVVEMQGVMESIAPRLRDKVHENWQIDGPNRVVLWFTHGLRPAVPLQMPETELRWPEATVAAEPNHLRAVS